MLSINLHSVIINMPAIELPKQQASYVHNQIMTSSTPAPVPATIDLPLPLSPQTILHLQITPLETSILAFLTTTDQSNATSLSPLGSFVYAMPNVRPLHPLALPVPTQSPISCSLFLQANPHLASQPR